MLNKSLSVTALELVAWSMASSIASMFAKISAAVDPTFPSLEPRLRTRQVAGVDVHALHLRGCDRLRAEQQPG